MKLPLPGRHNAMNALAATAAALEAGAEPEHVRAGLEKLQAVAGRLEIKTGCNGARVIDDTYNANPASVAAGLDVLRQYPGESALVLGDMGELGEAAPAIHRRVGELAKRLGVARLWALGELAGEAAAAFGPGGERVADTDALIEAVREAMNPQMTVLVKGSRAARMERVVAGLSAQEKPGCC